MPNGLRKMSVNFDKHGRNQGNDGQDVMRWLLPRPIFSKPRSSRAAANPSFERTDLSRTSTCVENESTKVPNNLASCQKNLTSGVRLSKVHRLPSCARQARECDCPRIPVTIAKWRDVEARQQSVQSNPQSRSPSLRRIIGFAAQR